MGRVANAPDERGDGRRPGYPTVEPTTDSLHDGAVEFTHLGRSGLTVSRLCLGTMNFGPFTPEADAHSIMDAALDYGINFFDTANAYGNGSELGGGPDSDRGKGSTEQIIGR